MEAETGAHMENMQEFSHLTKGKSLPSELQKHKVHASFNQKLLMHEIKTGGKTILNFGVVFSV